MKRDGVCKIYYNISHQKLPLTLKANSDTYLFESNCLRLIHDKFRILEILSNVMAFNNPSTQQNTEVVWDPQVQH